MTARLASPRPVSAVATLAFSRRTVTPPARPTARPAFRAATLATAASPAARASSAASTPTPTRPTAVRRVLSARRRVSFIFPQDTFGKSSKTDFRALPTRFSRQRPRNAHLLVRSLPSRLPGRLLPAGRSVDHQPVVLVRPALDRAFVATSPEPRLTPALFLSTATTVRVRSSRTKRVERRVLEFDRVYSGMRSHVPSSYHHLPHQSARPFVVLHTHTLSTLTTFPSVYPPKCPSLPTFSPLHLYHIGRQGARRQPSIEPAAYTTLFLFMGQWSERTLYNSGPPGACWREK